MTIPDDYIDQEHKGTAKRMLHVFYSATNKEGGTADEIYLRGVKAVLQDDNLAARPLLEQVARMGDCIGQHTVGEITAISDRAAAWLLENPPGQIAQPAEGEVGELVAELREIVEAYQYLHASSHIWKVSPGPKLTTDTLARAADLLAQLAPVQPVPVGAALNVVFDSAPGPDGPRFIEVETDDGRSVRAGEWIKRPDGNWALRFAAASQPVAVSERLPEPEHCDAEGRCWWFNRAAVPEWQLASDGPYGDAWLPAHALPLPTTGPQP